ncbi:MAG: hypothetical protein WDN26_13230 [Chitinophagaceae bacterium]
MAEFPYTDCFEIGQQVLEEHNKINSVELWNLESIHSTINQVAYYKEAGETLDQTKISMRLLIHFINGSITCKCKPRKE